MFIKISQKMGFYLFLGLVLLFYATTQGFAAGFALIEQSVSGLGKAFAGSAASAEDASTIFFNPAGLTKIKNKEVILGGHLIMPTADYDDKGSKKLIGNLPLTGNDGKDPGVTKFIPNLYLAIPIKDKLAFGLGVSVPFGLATEYDKDWVGRYHAIKSEVMTLNVNPSLALKLSDNLSLGIGLNYLYVEAELTSAIDQGLILFAQTRNATFLNLKDGFSRLKGDAWAFGWNAGLLWDVNQKWRIGLAYRSELTPKLEGNAKFENIHPFLQNNVRFKNQDAEAKIHLPATASLSFLYQMSPRLILLGDITWTGWSRFEELRIKYALHPQDTVITTKWQDSYRYSLGLSYKWREPLILRAGVAYDETPIRSARYRTPRIPDSDRFWIALGVGYNFTKNLALDAGYVHIFFRKASIDKNILPEDTFRGNLKGEFTGSVDIMSMQFKYHF